VTDLLPLAAVAFGGPLVSLALIVIHRLTAVDLQPTRSRGSGTAADRSPRRTS